MTTVEECERCESKIVEHAARPTERTEFWRVVDDASFESERIKLCTMCLDDIWEFVFEEDIDRSDKADPVPLERMGDNVDQYIDDLEQVLKAIEAEA